MRSPNVFIYVYPKNDDICSRDFRENKEIGSEIMPEKESRGLKTSIFGKMMLGICLPAVIVFVVAIFLILSTVQKSVFTLSDEVLTSKSQTASAEVGKYLSEHLEAAKQMSANSAFEDLFKSTVDKNQRITQQPGFGNVYRTMLNVKNTDPENIAVAWISDFDSSQFTQSDGYLSGLDYDITTRDWYQELTAANKAIVTEPYVDTSTQKPCVSAIAPVYDSATGKMIGSAGVDFSIDKLKSMMESYKLGQNGFFMLLSAQGTLIYYPDSQYLEKNISETDISDNIKQAVANQQEGEYTYTALGQAMHGYLSKDSTTGYMVISGLPDSEYNSSVNTLRNAIITIFAIALIVLVVVVVLLSLSIVRPIRNLKNAANHIADGQLDVDLRARSRDEVGQVTEAFGRTVGRLKNYIDYINEISAVLNQVADGDLVFELKHDYVGEFEKIKTSLLNIRKTLSQSVNQMTLAANQVSVNANQVSQGAQSLAQGATEQASSIQELSATVLTMAEQVKKNARDAEAASHNAEKSGQEIVLSNTQMQKMMDAITEIKSTSNKVVTIINTIDNIAFQTNILALNAAVEAARAGAGGKGFAVVAGEVKNLASKSSESAKNTAELINSSLRAVEDGISIAEQTSKTMMEAVSSSKETVKLIDDIAAASSEQATVISQITEALSQISSVVQNTSATAEESAAASEELNSQSHLLQQLVNKFTVDENDLDRRYTQSTTEDPVEDLVEY